MVEFINIEDFVDSINWWFFCILFSIDILGTVDYINEANGYVVFRTTPLEKDKLIFQMGTANAERAVKLAKMVQNDVSGIGRQTIMWNIEQIATFISFDFWLIICYRSLDVNMGCPRPYSGRFI